MSEEIDFTHLTLQERVNAKLDEATQLEKEATEVETDILREVLRAKARGIRGTVFALAEEEYKFYFMMKEIEEHNSTDDGAENRDFEEPQTVDVPENEASDYDPEANTFEPSESTYGDGEGA